ncbi:hypothetical protein IFM89_006014 [Coptis chinensis]|uniref:Uncharacterized protein n=1 Tax=Coptis chinensis TaxID=261450 RepID=A0A835I111_9MAGN|nr:hypothetical protein IFM89_006014 [Coptis chinensis]
MVYKQAPEPLHLTAPPQSNQHFNRDKTTRMNRKNPSVTEFLDKTCCNIFVLLYLSFLVPEAFCSCLVRWSRKLVTEPSQILNDTFQAQLPDNMHQYSSTLMKEKQRTSFRRSTDIPNSSNKKNRTDKTYKRKAYVVISTEDSNESSQTSVIRPPSKRVRKIKENKKHKGYLLSRFIGLSDKDLRLPWGKRRYLVPYPITDPDVETDSKPFDRDREPIADLFRDRNPVLATPILVATAPKSALAGFSR